jgi:zinc protease
MNNMPKAQKQFDLARETIMKRIETERITKTNIYNTFQTNKDRGIEYDIRRNVYETMQTTTLEELEEFANNHVSGKNYTFLILGSRDMIDMGVLINIGHVQELTLEEIFGY